MNDQENDFERYIYSMALNSKGWFVQLQLDQSFKGFIQDIKDLMNPVMLHTERENVTAIRNYKHTVNLDGYFEKEIGDEIHKRFLARIKSKPKCYG